MILYLDTSALVKIYVEEEGTEAVERAVEEAEWVATSVVAYAEARSALARRERDGALSSEGYREAVASLDEEWETYEGLSVTESVARLAGDLAERHALRGFDAIHLASALLVRAASEGQEEDTVRFFGFDNNLLDAAEKEMRLYEPGEASS